MFLAPGCVGGLLAHRFYGGGDERASVLNSMAGFVRLKDVREREREREPESREPRESSWALGSRVSGGRELRIED